MNLNPNVTQDFMNAHIDRRVTGFNEGAECIAVESKRKVDEWHGDGAYVVANAGAYDGLGLNHIRGLIQARILGAAYRLGSVEDLGAVYDLASSDEIRLLLSLDTNEAVAENKSFRPATGDSIRPLFDWKTRARMLALQSMQSRHDLVDFITKHGPNACPVCEGDTCWHSDKTYSVASSGADLTIVKSLNRSVVERYPESQFHIIDEGDGAFFDEVLGAQISTTALVKRVKHDRGNVS